MPVRCRCGQARTQHRDRAPPTTPRPDGASLGRTRRRGTAQAHPGHDRNDGTRAQEKHRRPARRPFVRPAVAEAHPCRNTGSNQSPAEMIRRLRRITGAAGTGPLRDIQRQRAHQHADQTDPLRINRRRRSGSARVWPTCNPQRSPPCRRRRGCGLRSWHGRASDRRARADAIDHSRTARWS